MSKFLDEVIEDYPQLSVCKDSIEEAYQVLESCYRSNCKLLVCGNGGSASDSEHIAGELLKGFYLKRKLGDSERIKFRDILGQEGDLIVDNLQGALPTIALTGHPSLSTAFANDVNPDFIFAQQLYGLGNKGDVLLAISTSGNSKNVIWASKVAKAMGIKVIGLTGGNGGLLAEYSEVCIKAPGRDVARIQEMHLPIYHTLCAWLEETFFGSK